MNERKWIANKAIYIDYKTEVALEVKRVIKKILLNKTWSRRYRAPVKLIPKWIVKLNVCQQERICKAAIAHQQVISNILSFEVSGLTFVDGPISE